MIVNDYADIVIGLQYGDEGKGKIASSIAQKKHYDLVARYNGGPNAGHSVHLDGDRIVKLHQIPTGVIFKKQSYIGPGCVLDFNQLDLEREHFQQVMNFDPYDYLTISPQAIVIDTQHKEDDSKYHSINQGSTRKGIAPAYASFYNRTAQLANSFSWPSNNKECIEEITSVNTILLEGAQGWYLNPYQGSYPYTTSSSCHPGAAAATFGFTADAIKDIIGVAKCYETRSGIDPDFQKVINQNNQLIKPDVPTETVNQCYELISQLGQEYGVTTGRKRHIRFLDVNRLINAINQSGTTLLVLQKWDILQEVSAYNINPFCYYFNGNLQQTPSLDAMYISVTDLIKKHCPLLTRFFMSAEQKCTLDWEDILYDD